MNNVNIAEFLSKAPRGMEVKLYSPLIGDCRLESVSKDLIWVIGEDGFRYSFHNSGTYFSIGECLLFPDKAKTWEHWQEHFFEKGCFVKNTSETFLYMGDGCMQNDKGDIIETVCLDDYRFASGSEISSFLNRLFERGLKYNVNEKKIEPRFKAENEEEKTDAVRLSVSKRLIHEFSLTQKQYDVVKAVIDVITNKK